MQPALDVTISHKRLASKSPKREDLAQIAYVQDQIDNYDMGDDIFTFFSPAENWTQICRDCGSALSGSDCIAVEETQFADSPHKTVCVNYGHGVERPGDQRRGTP